MPRFLDPPAMRRATVLGSQGVLVGSAFKRLIATPQAGSRSDGTFPEGLEAQLELALDHVLALVAVSGLEPRDIVRLSIYTSLTGAAALCARIRDGKMAPHRPACGYREIAGFADPACLVEVEAEAVREE